MREGDQRSGLYLLAGDRETSEIRSSIDRSSGVQELLSLLISTT
jgi:hypothetical protein